MIGLSGLCEGNAMSYDFSDMKKSVAYRFAFLRDCGICAVFFATITGLVFVILSAHGIPQTVDTHVGVAGSGVCGLVSILIGWLGFNAYI